MKYFLKFFSLLKLFPIILGKNCFKKIIMNK